jgi:hypothetical protein
MSAKGRTQDATQTSVPFDETNDPQDLPPSYEATTGTSHQRPVPPQNYRPGGMPSSSYPGAHYMNGNNQHPGSNSWNPSAGFFHPPGPPPGAPFNYPPGYVCHYCNNTGVKLHNGHLCGQCERNFGRQSGNVMYSPPGAQYHNHGGVTYMAGDPRIGGRLCGNCKGRGIRSSLFGMVEEQCK